MSRRIQVKKTTSSSKNKAQSWSDYTLDELDQLPAAYLCKKRPSQPGKKFGQGGSKKQYSKKKGKYVNKATKSSAEDEVQEYDPTIPECCLGKDKSCFTLGGCFCDESCQHFDDCCPDYDYGRGFRKTKKTPRSKLQDFELQVLRVSAGELRR